MTEFYIESADRPTKSGIATEDVEPGELVAEGANGVGRYAYADAPLGPEGVAEYDPEVLAADNEDTTAQDAYLSADDDRVPYGGGADGDVIKVMTPEDNGTDPAPSISHGDLLVVVDDTAIAGTGDEYIGRVVEEGYADSTPTTFNRSNNNAVVVGRAYRPGKQNDQEPVTDYDAPIRMMVFGEVQS